jgi:hypothetical protein
MTAGEYMQKVKELADAMAAAGSPFSDDNIIDYMLTGLGQAFNPITASLNMATVPVTLPSFYSMVLNYEALQQSQQAEGDEWTSSANAVSRPGQTNLGRPSGGASVGYQQQPNYQQQDRRPSGGSTGNQQQDRRRDGGGQDRCRDGGGNGRNGGGNNGRRWRPKCQICKN